MKKLQVFTNTVIIAIVVSICFIAFPTKKNYVQTATNPYVIYAGNKNENNVSFMINVYTGSEYILDILDVFDLYQAKTTFFVGGCWAVKNIDLLKEIYSRGHEIANHGYYHKDQDKLSYDKNKEEISMNHKLIQSNLGYEMTLFAPPSGAYNDTVVEVARDLGYQVIMWTHDTIDWRDHDTALITKRATQKLSNGDLILMHPTKNTLEALSGILSYAKNNGFNPTTVSNTISQ